MAKTLSHMPELGMQAPDFALPDIHGKRVCRDDFASAPALLVMFICNHCPYVVHIKDKLVAIANEYSKKGVAIVAISANDVEAYPDDSPEQMRNMALAHHFAFPYLYDETQNVAKEYRAACTPDFFLFDDKRRLVYRGQFDDSRPGNSVPVSGTDLRQAIEALLQGRPISAEQKPSIGCNIKWKATHISA